jgi:hypothetical protein
MCKPLGRLEEDSSLMYNSCPPLYNRRQELYANDWIVRNIVSCFISVLTNLHIGCDVEDDPQWISKKYRSET